MPRIFGNVTATPNPQPDFAQTDSRKANYIRNNPISFLSVDSDIETKCKELQDSSGIYIITETGSGRKAIFFGNEIYTNNGKIVTVDMMNDVIKELKEYIDDRIVNSSQGPTVTSDNVLSIDKIYESEITVMDNGTLVMTKSSSSSELSSVSIENDILVIS